jgi:hypothetical protein
MPFAADPLSGLWYPPLWLLALLPGAPAINALFWAHLVLSGLGMFLLLRSEKLTLLGAFTGSLAFAGMPKIVGHIGLGHLSLVSAVAWSPWVLLSVGCAIDGVGDPRSIRRFLVVGALVGVVFLADPRWIVPICLVTVGYGGWRWKAGPGGHRSSLPGLLKGTVGAGLSLVAVCATFAVPLLELVGLTTRTNLTKAAADVFALPPARLLGLLVSSPGTWAEWTVSMGSAALVLAAAGIAAWPKRTVFWAAVLGVALVLALGQATPLGALFVRAPVVEMLRVPARWLFLAGLALAALVAHGLSAIEGQAEANAIRRMRLATLFIGAAVVLVSLAFNLLSETSAGGSGLFGVLAVLGVWLGLRSPPVRLAAPALTLVLFVELCSIDIPFIESRPADRALGSGRSIAAHLVGEEAGRVFSPSYAVPQEAASEAGLELADGVHPLQLASYVEFMGAAAGFATDSYSVTLPPFPSGDPAVDWGPSLDAEALGLLGIGRIASTFPIDAPELSLDTTIEGVLVYRNHAARPRAWIEPSASDDFSVTEVASIEHTPNRVEIRASGPGRLVLSDPMYPGWRATIDGVDVPIEPYQGLLRAVLLPTGEHTVRFRFVPLSLIAGLVIALGAALGAVVSWKRP